jgi:hypothetical protein
MHDPFNEPTKKSALFSIRVTRMRAFVVVLLVVIAGCGGAAVADKPPFQSAGEKESNAIADAAFHAVPYPLAKVKAGGFLERRNLSERLSRFSDANKLGYVYVMSFGKFLGYYSIKGKITSNQSQMTNPTQTWDNEGHCSGCGHYGMSAESIGDDGSYGENEPGVFFFTTAGVMVVTNLDYMYVDKPLTIGNIPQLYQ